MSQGMVLLIIQNRKGNARNDFSRFWIHNPSWLDPELNLFESRAEKPSSCTSPISDTGESWRVHFVSHRPRVWFISTSKVVNVAINSRSFIKHTSISRDDCRYLKPQEHYNSCVIRCMEMQCHLRQHFIRVRIQLSHVNSCKCATLPCL